MATLKKKTSKIYMVNWRVTHKDGGDKRNMQEWKGLNEKKIYASGEDKLNETKDQD